MYFLICPKTCSLMDEVCCLVSKCLGIFLLFLLLIPLWSDKHTQFWFQLSGICWGLFHDGGYGLFGKCSTGAWKEWVFCGYCMGCSINKCQLDSVGGGLEFFYILADLSFQFYPVLLHIFCRPVGWCRHIQECCVFLVDWPFYHYTVLASVPGNLLCSEVYIWY